MATDPVAAYTDGEVFTASKINSKTGNIYSAITAVENTAAANAADIAVLEAAIGSVSAEVQIPWSYTWHIEDPTDWTSNDNSRYFIPGPLSTNCRFRGVVVSRGGDSVGSGNTILLLQTQEYDGSLLDTLFVMTFPSIAPTANDSHLVSSGTSEGVLIPDNARLTLSASTVGDQRSLSVTVYGTVDNIASS